MLKSNKGQRGFSLLELIIVIIIVGILATLGVSQYYVARERSLDKEAIANLKLIQAGERIFRLQNGSYSNCTDNTDINTRLHLTLPAGDSRNWDYRVDGASTANFNGRARRNLAGSSRLWCINATVEDPFNESSGCTW